MKYIVTGSTGFLGKALINKLNQLGHDTFSYDITSGYDICNQTQLEDVINLFKPDAVIHLAAVANLNIYQDDIAIGEKINIGGTRSVLSVCDEHNIRLLFASTCCAYGNTTEYPSTETSPLCTKEPYALSKIISENDILKSNKSHCCMRFATFFGPDMRQALACGSFMHSIHHETPITLHGSGKQTRTLTYIDDIVSGIITIAATPPKYNIVNITTTESVSVLDMIRAAEECVGKKACIIMGEDREHQTFREDISNERLKSLGWKCENTFEEGMKETYQWYIKNNYRFNC